jgi:hypothetical protein
MKDCYECNEKPPHIEMQGGTYKNKIYKMKTKRNPLKPFDLKDFPQHRHTRGCLVKIQHFLKLVNFRVIFFVSVIVGLRLFFHFCQGHS